MWRNIWAATKVSNSDNDIPVFETISIISDSAKQFQHLLIQESFSFDILFAACRIANSSLLNSNGLTTASTSSASRPAVPGTPKHNFVCLFVCFTSQVNSYGHCGTVSSPNHSFFLGKLEQAVNQ